MEPLYISLKIAIVATFFTFFIGIGLAYVVVYIKHGSALIDTLLTVPLVLPPTVTGFFLLVLFGRNGTIGQFLEQFGIRIVFTWWGAVIASLCVALPLMYRTTKGAFAQFDQNLLYVGRTLGLSEFVIFYKVVLPNCLPVIVAATILTFARTLGEFGATIMIAGNLPGKTQTMSIAIYQAVQTGNRALAYRWIGILFVLSFLCVGIMNGMLYSMHGRRKPK